MTEKIAWWLCSVGSLVDAFVQVFAFRFLQTNLEHRLFITLWRRGWFSD